MKPLIVSSLKITVGARESPLSRAQVNEVHQELIQHYPDIELQPIFVKTTGDIDRQTSLKTLGQTDFFTKEIDAMQRSGICRIAIHSAKDLASPLPEGIVIAALTQGVDPSDVLVLRDGETLESLRRGALIATSSQRREENVAVLKKDCTFVDIRGYIDERLKKLFCHEVDGIVVAKAALIRLGLIHLNQVVLPAVTAPLQGRLAITAKEGDCEMIELFKIISCIGKHSPMDSPLDSFSTAT